jgi:ParB/RepB/Spo0J family partition protein
MATTEFPVVEQIFKIPIERLFLSKTNPRGDPTPEALGDLAADIANRGVVQAIVVRPKQERFEVVFGKRRFLASDIAKKATVPCVIREMSDDGAFELQIVENLQRENLHPLLEAAAFKRLYDKAYKQTKNHDQAITVVAERIGKKYRPEDIAKRLKLNDLVDEAKQAFRSERLILGHAEELARLRPEEQTATLKWLLSRTTRANGKEVPIVPGVPELRVWIRQNIFLDLRQAPFDTSDPNLHAKMGPCSSCEFKTGNQPGLFNDVQQGDTCTVPSCWRQKRDNHLVQIATASAKELGVKKVLKVGLGYRSWNHDRVPVDAYIEFDSSYRLVKMGDECPNTKPGIITFIAHPSDAQNLKIGSQVFVCTQSGKCSKHNHADSRSSARKTYEEMADTRMGNLRRDTPQRIRAAIIAAVIQAA